MIFANSQFGCVDTDRKKERSVEIDKKPRFDEPNSKKSMVMDMAESLSGGSQYHSPDPKAMEAFLKLNPALYGNFVRFEKIFHEVNDLGRGIVDDGILAPKTELDNNAHEPAMKGLKPSESIAFSDDDVVRNLPTPSEARVINATIANKKVHRVNVSAGCGIDIMFIDCFRKLEIKNAQLKPSTLPIVGFTNDVIKPHGIISLEVKVGKYPRDRTVICDFAIVDGPSPVNVILGRPWMNKVKAIWSEYHSVLKFPTDHGASTVRATGCPSPRFVGTTLTLG